MTEVGRLLKTYVYMNIYLWITLNVTLLVPHEFKDFSDDIPFRKLYLFLG